MKTKGKNLDIFIRQLSNYESHRSPLKLIKKIIKTDDGIIDISFQGSQPEHD